MSSDVLANATMTLPALTALVLFAAAYSLVIVEEFIQLRKSKPMVVASGLLWILVAWLSLQQGNPHFAETAIKKQLLDYGELLLFLIVAMTYINALTDRKVFEAIRAWLVNKGFSYRQLFWITGFLAFFISPIADNLTTALALSAVIIAIGKDQHRFIGISCINLVVAANAGGAFSPFGDITTLMVWQAGIIPFGTFFKLFLPALLNFLIPALCMHFALPKGKPVPLITPVHLGKGARRMTILFLLTILTSVLLHHFFNLPPVVGMMLGLGYLQMFAYYTKLNQKEEDFDIFPQLQKIEWDTLLFFYGVILCVGALSAFGYLASLSNLLYTPWSPSINDFTQITLSNSIIGIISALIDNIPVMFAVITMNPNMSEGQWLLVTLTTGVGGSLLSIGSAAGVALMGAARGSYSFLTHLKWLPAIALGYVVSILFHLWWNASSF